MELCTEHTYFARTSNAAEMSFDIQQSHKKSLHKNIAQHMDLQVPSKEMPIQFLTMKIPTNKKYSSIVTP